MPVLVGSGVPLLPAGALAKLELVDQKILPASSIVFLSYRVRTRRAVGVRIRYIKPRRSKAKSVARKRTR